MASTRFSQTCSEQFKTEIANWNNASGKTRNQFLFIRNQECTYQHPLPRVLKCLKGQMIRLFPDHVDQNNQGK